MVVEECSVIVACVNDSRRRSRYKLWLWFNVGQCKLGHEGGSQTVAQVPQELSTYDVVDCWLFLLNQWCFIFWGKSHRPKCFIQTTEHTQCDVQIWKYKYNVAISKGYCLIKAHKLKEIKQNINTDKFMAKRISKLMMRSLKEPNVCSLRFYQPLYVMWRQQRKTFHSRSAWESNTVLFHQKLHWKFHFLLFSDTVSSLLLHPQSQVLTVAQDLQPH